MGNFDGQGVQLFSSGNLHAGAGETAKRKCAASAQARCLDDGKLPWPCVLTLTLTLTLKGSGVGRGWGLAFPNPLMVMHDSHAFPLF